MPRSNKNNLVTIANALPHYDLNDLCGKLAWSGRLADEASLGATQIAGATEVDVALRECNLSELCDEAAEFGRCVGYIQEVST